MTSHTVVNRFGSSSDGAVALNRGRGAPILVGERMHEETTPTIQVPAEVAPRALLRARKEVDQGCQVMMTSDTGMVALALPERLLDLPETPELELRLAAIARYFSLRGHVTDAGELLATAARHTLGGTLAARTTRRTEPGKSPRMRPGRGAAVTGLRPALR